MSLPFELSRRSVCSSLTLACSPLATCRCAGDARSAGLAELARAAAEPRLDGKGPRRKVGSRGRRGQQSALEEEGAGRPLDADRHARQTLHDRPRPSRRRPTKARRSSASTPPPARSSGSIASTFISPTCRPSASAGRAASAIRKPAASTPKASAATSAAWKAKPARSSGTAACTKSSALISTYGGRTNVPVVFEDTVLISAVVVGWGDEPKWGGLARPAHRFMCFDKATGELRWLNGTGISPYDTTYSTPTVLPIGGQQQLVFGSGDGGVWALQPRTGKAVWNFPFGRCGHECLAAGDARRHGLRQPQRGEHVSATRWARSSRSMARRRAT